MDDIEPITLYKYLPKGSKSPHIQCRKGSFDGWFVIPKFDNDWQVECTGIKECFIKINRGYFCKKHGKQ